MTRAEWSKNVLDQLDSITGGPMLDYDLKNVVTTVSPCKRVIVTKGCPSGLTVGPWREWQETIWTSCGRCFSKAAFSGDFTDV